MAEFDLGTARGRIVIDSTGAAAGAAAANASVNNLKRSSVATSAALTRTGMVMGGIGAVAVGAFAYAVNAAANFEERISGIGAVSGATAAELDKVREKALQLGADTKFSADQAAQGMEELIKAGLTVEQVLNGAADATTNLAAAGEIELVEAATISANAMNAFGLAAQDLPKVADLIAGAANASAIDVGQFGQALAQSGATANLVGLSFDDLAVSIAAMGNAGIKGSDAGTSLKTFLANLQPTTKKQKELFDELGITVDGVANKFFDANGSIKSMSEVAGILNKATANMTDQQKMLALETMFGTDAIRAAAIVANNGSEGFDKLSTAMGKVTAAEVAAKRMDNLKGSLEELKGSIDTALIKAGSPFQKALKTFVDGLTKLVNAFSALPASVQKWIVMAILGLGVVLLLGGAFLVIAGTLLKVAATFRTLRTAMGIGKIIRGLITAMNALRLAFLANPVFLFIAALVLLGVFLWQLYQRSQTFRDVVSSLGDVFKSVGAFLVDFVMGIIELPGKIVAGLAAVTTAVGNFVASLWRKFIELHVKVGEALARVVTGVISWGARMISTGARMASDFVSRIVNGIRALPGRVGDIFGRIIATIKEKISQAFNAVKQFAANMWNGFKEGLGINSPSFIEEAMFAMTDNVAKSTKMLSAQVRTVQGLGAGIPSLSVAQGAGVVSPMAPAAAAAASAQGAGQVIQLEINNPVPEAAEDSIHREMQKLQVHGILARPV